MTNRTKTKGRISIENCNDTEKYWKYGQNRQFSILSMHFSTIENFNTDSFYCFDMEKLVGDATVSFQQLHRFIFVGTVVGLYPVVSLLFCWPKLVLSLTTADESEDARVSANITYDIADHYVISQKMVNSISIYLKWLNISNVSRTKNYLIIISTTTHDCRGRCVRRFAYIEHPTHVRIRALTVGEVQKRFIISSNLVSFNTHSLFAESFPCRRKQLEAAISIRIQ